MRLSIYYLLYVYHKIVLTTHLIDFYGAQYSVSLPANAYFLFHIRHITVNVGLSSTYLIENHRYLLQNTNNQHIIYSLCLQSFARLAFALRIQLLCESCYIHNGHLFLMCMNYKIWSRTQCTLRPVSKP